MARRRGFFAEMAHRQAVAAKNQQRDQAAAAREHARLVREQSRLEQGQARARDQQVRASAAAADAAAKQRAQLHLERRTNETALLNARLAEQLTDLEGLLGATLTKDDYVDLEQLRVRVDHPPFSSANQTPEPPPALPQAPAEPLWVPPEEPTGMAAHFGGKRKYAAALAEAQGAYAAAHQQWQAESAQIPAQQLGLMTGYQEREAARVARLADDQRAYQRECEDRQRDADQTNARLDELIAGLNAGTRQAVEEYVGIVFGNSAYPDFIPGVRDISFDDASGELTVVFELPRPDQLPTIREYRYVKAKDEIVTTPQTQKEMRDRYNAVVAAVTLRTLHEIWEADRAGWIRTISFTAIVIHLDPATGHDTETVLVQLAAEREQILGIDLAQVTPTETLAHLHANVSKNPFALIPASAGQSVRGSRSAGRHEATP